MAFHMLVFNSTVINKILSKSNIIVRNFTRGIKKISPGGN